MPRNMIMSGKFESFFILIDGTGKCSLLRLAFKPTHLSVGFASGAIGSQHRYSGSRKSTTTRTSP